jgi:hypothetical protein
MLIRGKGNQEQEKEQEKIRNKDDDSLKIEGGFMLMNARFRESTGL